MRDNLIECSECNTRFEKKKTVGAGHRVVCSSECGKVRTKRLTKEVKKDPEGLWREDTRESRFVVSHREVFMGDCIDILV